MAQLARSPCRSREYEDARVGAGDEGIHDAVAATDGGGQPCGSGHFLTQWTRWNRVVAVDVFCRWWQVTLRARGVRGPCALLSKFGGPWPRALVPFITCCLPKGVCVGCGGVGYSSCAHCWIFWCHVCWAAMQACKSVEWDQVHALESTTICSGCHKKMRYQQRLMEHEEEMCAKKDILKPMVPYGQPV